MAVQQVDVQKYFDKVSNGVSHKWDDLAPKLGFSENEIKGIRTDERNQDRRCREMLHRWRNREGSRATLQDLKQALVDIGERRTKESLEGELDRYNGHEVNVNGLITKEPACIPNYTLQWTESNGTNGRDTVEQRAGTSRDGTQHLNGRTEDGHETNSTTSSSRPHFMQPSNAKLEGKQQNRKIRKRRKLDKQLQRKLQGRPPRPRKRLKADPEAGKMSVSIKDEADRNNFLTATPPDVSVPNGSDEDEGTIYHTVVETAERVFNKKTVQDHDEFEKCVKSFEHVASAVPDEDVIDIKPKLQSKVKLRIKDRVSHKIKEIAQNLFRDKVLHPEDRELFHKMAECFGRFQAALRKAERGCVFCHLDFANAGCYDTFWRGCSDGSLSDTLTRELITDDMRAAEDGADLYIHVQVLHSAAEEGDFSDQDPSGTADRGPPHPGPSGHRGSSNHGDDTPPGYHGDGPGGLQVSGGDYVMRVKQEPAEQVPPCCTMGTVKSEARCTCLGSDVETNTPTAMETDAPAAVETDSGKHSTYYNQLMLLADRLGPNWTWLALQLGFTSTDVERISRTYHPSYLPHWCLWEWVQRELWGATMDAVLVGLRAAGLHQIADAVLTGELFQKDVDDGSWGSEGKGQGDKGDGSSSDGDSDDDEHTSDESLPDDNDREGSASGSGGSHSNNEEEDIPQEEGISTLDSASQSSTANQYPTGEDALAWNDCLQDFFKTDEDTARSIQQSWPSNLLVKHLIRDSKAKDAFQFVHDSIRQFLIAYWVAHTVRTQNDCTELLRVCAEKSDHLPITCCSLAHLLSRTDSPPTHLQQFVTFLIQRQGGSGDFNRLLSIVTTITESKHLEEDQDSRFPTLKMLGFSNCNLTSEDILPLLSQLPTLPNLEEIDLSSNAISDEAVSGLAKGLGSCQNLKKVNLSHNKLSGRGDFLPPLPNLEEINLSHNAISDKAVPGLAKGLGSCQNLKKVNLSHNKLSGRGDFLPPLPNLEEIDISNNDISDEAVSGLAKGLGSCQNLKKVHLCHNKLSNRGDFLPPLPNLEEINLSHNAISDKAVPGLAKGLGSCQNLKKVNLSYNKLSGRGDFLPPLPNLEKIDLSHNDISDEVVPGLAEGLGSCQNLKKVVLSFNKLSDVGELINAFINLPILTRADIGYNSIRDESLPAIAAWLNVRTAMKDVWLFSNRFSAEGVRDFVRTMEGKSYRWPSDILYDGSLADVDKFVESGGEGARREEQQWERLRGETGWIDVKVGQLKVGISHRGPRS
ncbi:hypothetical protein Bbelb_309170 [Branchiostoma belcheri]|nr:hypothetical protein Bbelb_309170 [Branchiostoma belcheri]